MSDLDYSSNLSCSAIFNSSAIMKFTSDYLNLLENTINIEKPEFIPSPRNSLPNLGHLHISTVSSDSKNLSENLNRNIAEAHFSHNSKDRAPSYKIRVERTPSVFSNQNEEIATSKQKVKENQNLNPKKRHSYKVIPDYPKLTQDASPSKQHTKSTPVIFGKNPFLPVQSQSNLLQVIQSPNLPSQQSVNLSSESRKTPAFGLSILSNSSGRKSPCFGLSSINQYSKEINSIISHGSEASLKLPVSKKRRRDILETNPESQESEEMIKSSIKIWLKDHKEVFEQPSCWCFIRSDDPFGMIEGLKNEKKYDDLKKCVVDAIGRRFGIEMPEGKYSLLDLCLVYDVLREIEGEVKDVYQKVKKSSRKRLCEIKKKKVDCFEKGIDLVFEMVKKDLVEED